jgi:hypothetical protein
MHALFRRIELVRVLLRSEDHTQAMLNVIADFLSAQYVTCEQFCELLGLFSSAVGRTSGLALPLIALQYHEVKINIEYDILKDLSMHDVIIRGDVSKVWSFHRIYLPRNFCLSLQLRILNHFLYNITSFSPIMLYSHPPNIHYFCNRIEICLNTKHTIAIQISLLDFLYNVNKHK